MYIYIYILSIYICLYMYIYIYIYVYCRERLLDVELAALQPQIVNTSPFGVVCVISITLFSYSSSSCYLEMYTKITKYTKITNFTKIYVLWELYI